MARRIDLGRQRDNSNFHMHRDTRPFLYEDELDENNENPQDNLNEEDENNYNDYYYEQGNDSNEYTGTRPSIRQTLASALGRKRKKNNSGLANNALESAENEIEGQAIRFIMRKLVLKKVILIAIPIILVLLLITFLFASIIEIDGKSGLATGGYYAMKCPEITVIFVDKSNDYAPIDSETFEFEEYVAGVIRGEMAMLHNIEMYKEFALLARTYAAGKIGDDCTIEASDRRQVFARIEDGFAYADMIYQAVQETKGQVILQDNELVNVHYDAFCSIAVDDNYYTIKQASQKIPRSWVDSQPGIAASWKQGNCAGNHGMGVSTWGSYYLVTEEGYTYDEVLKYYLGDDIMISRGGFIGSIDGLEIKDTVGATPLNESLSSALEEHGSSIEELNSFIHDNVEENGAGTRAGVVTAAVSLIDYLYDGMGVKIPYYWNGKHQVIGVPSNLGGLTTPSAHGETHAGFDCSGFVSWAIMNGGYNFSGVSTKGFDQYAYGDDCYMSESSCIGQPGDLLNSTDCGSGIGHVQLIVAVDEDSGVYYIAESSYGVTMTSVPIHGGRCANMKVLHMDNYYNNSANINYNY